MKIMITNTHHTHTYLVDENLFFVSITQVYNTHNSDSMLHIHRWHELFQNPRARNSVHTVFQLN